MCVRSDRNGYPQIPQIAQMILSSPMNGVLDYFTGVAIEDVASLEYVRAISG
jgi:hypothetical protein